MYELYAQEMCTQENSQFSNTDLSARLTDISLAGPKT
jgi:hypothetical protein